MSDPSFDGAVVFISGAARGFGALAAREFASRGARLILTDILANELGETASNLKDAGHEVEATAGDISHEPFIASVLEAGLAKFGKLNVALNNAGVVHSPKKLADLDAHALGHVMRVDLFAVFFAMKYQLPVMERQKQGAILNVSSVAGITGAPLLSIYSAAKHGVIGLTKSAALEYARHNVRINAICPSFAETKMMTDSLHEMRGTAEEAAARMLSAIPMRRAARPQEVVQAMLWICSPQNSFLTGQSIAIDGGLTAA